MELDTFLSFGIDQGPAVSLGAPAFYMPSPAHDPDDPVPHFVFQGSVHLSVTRMTIDAASCMDNEHVFLSLDTEDPFERSAVRVDNVFCRPVGYLHWEHAALVAPLLSSTRAQNLVRLSSNLQILQGGFGWSVSVSVQTCTNEFDAQIDLLLAAQTPRDVSLENDQQPYTLPPINVDDMDLPDVLDSRDQDDAQSLASTDENDFPMSAAVHAGVSQPLTVEFGARALQELSNALGLFSGNMITAENADSARALPVSVGGALRHVQDTQREAMETINSQEGLDKLFDEENMKKTRAPPFDISRTPRLTTDLLPHQKVGVSWMIDRERNDALPVFWKEVTTVQGIKKYYNPLTAKMYKERPEPTRGGILSDEMGLGKTLQVLTLILANPAPGVDYSGRYGGCSFKSKRAKQGRLETKDDGVESVCKNSDEKSCEPIVQDDHNCSLFHLESGEGDHDAGECAEQNSNGENEGRQKVLFKSRATLIVAPVSVISNWQEQIAEHVSKDTLTVSVYHGSERESDMKVLSDNDIILTTYGTISAEFRSIGRSGKRKRSGQLRQISFHRIVLDEGHIIRNRAAMQTRAIFELADSSQHKWVLTGSPYVNSQDDIWPLIRVIGLKPLDSWSTYRHSISRPMLRRTAVGLSRLRTVVTNVTLRRTKQSVPEITDTIPEMVSDVTRIEMDERQKEAYMIIRNCAKRIFDASIVNGVLDDNERGAVMHKILEVAMRLRQICVCPRLVKSDRIESARKVLEKLKKYEEGKSAPMSAEDAKKLLAQLSGAVSGCEDGPGDSCAVCFEEQSVENARILAKCGHCFCSSCLNRLMETGRLTCPLCRGRFVSSDIVSKSELETRVLEGETEVQNANEKEESAETIDTDELDMGCGPKIPYVIGAVTLARGQGEKSIVYSQFTGFLEHLEQGFNVNGWRRNVHYAVLLGSHTRDMRAAATALFRENPQCSALLVSMKAGSAGLNLTCATRVILCEPYWNVAQEEQAINRAHRIGQSRIVRCTRLITSSSIEEYISHVAKRKNLYADASLRKISAEDLRRMQLERAMERINGILSIS